MLSEKSVKSPQVVFLYVRELTTDHPPLHILSQISTDDNANAEVEFFMWKDFIKK